MSKLQSATVKVRPRVQIDFSNDPGVTQQHFKDEANINNIMIKYGARRVLEHYGQFKGNYGDFTDVQDYQESMNQVIAAQDMFATLPAKLRNRFKNDPSEFLAYVADEANRDEMKTLGLLKEEVQAPNLEPLAKLEESKNDPE